MKILITGGAGTLGSSLIEKFIPENHSVAIIDNFATGNKEVVPHNINNLNLFEGDIADQNLINDVVSKFKPELIIHSAASYKDPNDWIEDCSTNVIGSVNLAKAAIKYGVKKIINFQTALCYGVPEEIPISENAPTNPITSYGISKTAGEQFLIHSDLNVISLRLANICGPRLAIGPIPTFYKRLQEGKSCFCTDSYRDFIHMDDFLRLIDIIINGEFQTGVYNVSSGEAHSVKEIYDEVLNHLGIEDKGVEIVPVNSDDIQTVVLNPALTLKTFGWKTEVDFKSTIKKQLIWYDNYGVSKIYSHLAKK